MPFLRKLFSPRHPYQYFFLHIPKTAGTSFRKMLERDVFPFKGDVLPNKMDFKRKNRRGRYYQLAELMKLPPHRIQSCKLLCGHVPAVTQELFSSPPKTLLFLRDPVPRAISNLLFAQRTWHTTLSLSDILKNDKLRTEYITNRQTQLLSFRSLEEARIYDRKIIPDRSRLELAKEVLNSFDFLGITEEFERSIKLLEHTFNWKFTSGLMSDNRAPVPDEDLKVLIEKIQAENELDQELYEFGCDLFYRRLDDANLGSPQINNSA